MSREHDLDLAVDRFLEGELALEPATELQEQLASPELAKALSQELFLREFLATLPPDAPPDGLVERLQRALPAASAEPVQPATRARSLWEASSAGLLAGARWAVAGPSMAVSAPLEPLRKPEAPRPRKNVALAAFRFGATSDKLLRLGATSGKLLRLGAASGRALRLGGASSEAAVRVGAASGRVVRLGASQVVGAFSKRSAPEPWWRRALGRAGVGR
jgi:hypothetical protein